MFVFKFIIISIISVVFLFDNAESQAGLLKNLLRGVQNTVDNTVDLVQGDADNGLVGNVLTVAGNVAKAAMDGTERIVSDADDHLGDAARAAQHSLAALIKNGNETMKDLTSLVDETGMMVNGVLSNTMQMVGNVTGGLGAMMD